MADKRRADALSAMLESDGHHGQVAIALAVHDCAGEADDIRSRESHGRSLGVTNEFSKLLSRADAERPAVSREELANRLNL